LMAVFALAYHISLAQTINDATIIDSTIATHGIVFVNSKPIIDFHLERNDLANYFLEYKKRYGKALDTSALAEIIQNSKKTDSSQWNDSQLSKVVLVNKRDVNISIKKAIQKLQLADRKEIKFYSRQIVLYNSTRNFDRNIFLLSKPLYNNLRNFAIIQWDNGHGGLGGGGGIVGDYAQREQLIMLVIDHPKLLPCKSHGEGVHNFHYSPDCGGRASDLCCSIGSAKIFRLRSFIKLVQMLTFLASRPTMAHDQWQAHAAADTTVPTKSV
jgi:hypothetical protein